MRRAAKVLNQRETETLVALPPALWEEAKRIANEENWTLSQAIVFLAQCGADAHRSAEKELKRSYERIMNDRDAATKPQARKELMKAIFGSESIAED